MIKIDMEMPERCEDCGFCHQPWNEDVCFLDPNENVIEDTSTKPEWCGLIECEE